MSKGSINKQVELILEHMRNHGGITPMTAMSLYGCTRLGARIYDLKRLGYDINTEMVTGINRYGKKTHWARYTLAEESAPV